MKYLFLLILAGLVVLSVLTWRSLPESLSPVPVLYWVTDANPAREDQIHLFHLWQVKNGYTTSIQLESAEETERFLQNQGRFFRRSLLEINPDLQSPRSANYPLTITLPQAELRLDTANADVTKRIIQGVSNVGGDIMDMWSGLHMWQMQGMGLLRDVTEDAKRLNFGPDRTYGAILPEIAIPDSQGRWHQYQFPCNVVSSAYFVNLEQIKKAGMPPPPRTWTIAEFEAYGSEYVKRANQGLDRPRYFLINGIDNQILRRSFGASELNETMTACTIDDPRNVQAMKTYLRWQNDLKIIPSAVDRAGFATDSGYGGQDAQLFNAGNYAMLFTGRYLLIQFRKFNLDRVRSGKPPMELGFSEPPYNVFPNTNIGTRAAAVYSGGKHQDLSVLFLSYLASEDYNMQIVYDADSLPPNPVYTRTKDYLTPDPDPSRGVYPQTEYAVHGPFAEITQTIAVANNHSPFILQAVVMREIGYADDAIINGVLSPEQAYANAARRVNTEIALNLTENPRLKPLYDRKIEQQKQIDDMKEAILRFQSQNPDTAVPAELRIPLNLIDNPFHRAYYRKIGWIKE
ncbi:MAG: hypothetical protein KatS3mg104_2885 [Phycisphaerae bacterium]|jgi:multiple sugar transport system substrate-binding protein|nr:MAG: hypothetical protein KatS3mg104_2885 [Phycisphaerae bacterium]